MGEASGTTATDAFFFTSIAVCTAVNTHPRAAQLFLLPPIDLIQTAFWDNCRNSAGVQQFIGTQIIPSGGFILYPLSLQDVRVYTSDIFFQICSLLTTAVESEGLNLCACCNTNSYWLRHHYSAVLTCGHSYHCIFCASHLLESVHGISCLVCDVESDTFRAIRPIHD